MPYVKSFGLNPGLLTIATTSPVFGSTAAAVPGFPSRESNNFSWALISIVNCTFSPFLTGVSAIVVLCLSSLITETLMPSSPRSFSSKVSSNP